MQTTPEVEISNCFSLVSSAGRHCPADEFQCNNTLCKPLAWKCDGEDDCGDNSDENPEECSECSLVDHTHVECLSVFIRPDLCRPPHREVPVSSDQSSALPKRPCVSASVKAVRWRQQLWRQLGWTELPWVLRVVQIAVKSPPPSTLMNEMLTCVNEYACVYRDPSSCSHMWEGRVPVCQQQMHQLHSAL